MSRRSSKLAKKGSKPQKYTSSKVVKVSPTGKRMVFKKGAGGSNGPRTFGIGPKSGEVKEEGEGKKTNLRAKVRKVNKKKAILKNIIRRPTKRAASLARKGRGSSKKK